MLLHTVKLPFMFVWDVIVLWVNKNNCNPANILKELITSPEDNADLINSFHLIKINLTGNMHWK